MRKLPFHVTLFNDNSEVTSRCQFPTERAARKRYEQCIVSAECANVHRIILQRVDYGSTLGFGSRSCLNIGEWIKPVPKPDVQVAGYIVHSARSLKNGTPGRLGSKTFHKTYEDAERQARQLADKWKLGHEGLIVFKAVKHVKKVEYTPRPGTQIQVSDV